MAIVENSGADFGSSTRSLDTLVSDSNVLNDLDQSNSQQNYSDNRPILRANNDQNFHLKVHQQFHQHQQQERTNTIPSSPNHNKPQMAQVHHGVQNLQMVANSGTYGTHQRSNGVDDGEGFKRDMRDLEELLSKLNPMAEEFVPPSLANHGSPGGGFGYTNNNFLLHNTGTGIVNGNGSAGRRV